jgi:hypothetical protein
MREKPLLMQRYVNCTKNLVCNLHPIMGADAVIIPDPAEVAHAYRIGLHELCRTDSPRFVTIPESDRPVVQIPLSGDLIHAPTGAVLLQLRWVCVEGRINERVDHLEQPVFAWK